MNRLLLIVLSLTVILLSNANAAEMLVNGNFETGDLSGWQVTNIPTTGTCGAGDYGQDWIVDNSGSATLCTDPGPPPEGSYAAYNMFDGGTNAPFSYRLWQQVDLPNSITIATLSWSESISWSINGTLPRVFSIEILDSTATNILHTIRSNDYGPVSSGATGWVNMIEDLTIILVPLAGQTINLQFSVFVPETWRGPAGMGIDNVSLDITSSQSIPTLSEWGMVFMSLLFAGSALWMIRRRQIV